MRIEPFENVRRDGAGSISVSEAYAIAGLIEQHHPAKFIEIGTASGLSAGLIALAMSQADGAELHCIDANAQFFGDPSQPIGFMIQQVFSGARPSTEVHTKSTSLDLVDRFGVGAFDMGFVDANHEHPWPTIDLIAMAPCMKPGSKIIFHDLALYRKQEHHTSIGPKFLFDQVPHELRSVIESDQRNLFAVEIPANRIRLADALSSSLFIPWSTQTRIPFRMVLKLRAIIEEHWNRPLLSVFDTVINRFY